MFKVTDLVMNFIPFAVAGAVAVVIAKNGAAVILNLAKLVGCVYIGLAAFVIILIILSLLLKIPIFKLMVHVWEPVSIAFLTSSSEAVLPQVMEKMIEFGVPAPIVSFVIPTGYSFNLDGTTLYIGAASIFLLQASEINHTLQDQIICILTMMIMAKGVAGVPRASLALLVAGEEMFGFPAEGIAAIAAVDFIMDMARTAMNLFGNCLASVVIAKWEGEYPPREAETQTEDLMSKYDIEKQENMN
jgi:proton glutamate symport protein